MNKLVILAGPICSAKKEFVKLHGLEDYTLSIDNIRLMFDTPQMTEIGYEISQRDNKAVYDYLYCVLEQRMKRGAFTVIDGAHTQEKDFTKYKMLCKKYRYKMIIVPFHCSTEELTNDNNISRIKTPNDVIAKMKTQFDNLEFSFGTVILPNDFGKYIGYYPVDLSKYKKVNHIGDIHGCFTALSNIFPLKDDEFYIFLGDYFDRGIENVEVATWLLENIDKPNVVFLKGNHELYIEDYLEGNEIKSSDFEKTISEFEKGKIRKKDLSNIVNALCNMYLYKYGEKRVLCSHGGIGFYPENINYINPMQFIKGVGNFSTDIDAQFTAPENTYQVHGHRNIMRLPINAGKQSFNLTDEIEFGGYLRVLSLSKEGFKSMKYKNTVFAQRDISADKKMFETLAGDEYIKVKNFGDISSINFTRKAFYDKKWNERTIMARGLFVNNKNYNVVCRGYEKFFNVDEVPETTMESLKNISFPVTAYVKENGYLGLLGVDEITESFVFASKSSLDSDFARVFEEIVRETISADNLEKLRMELLMRNSCLVFEVIDPEFDPHIIEYSQRKVVLLDIIDKSYSFKKQAFGQLVSFAKRYGFECKKKAKTIYSYEALEKFIAKTKEYDFVLDGKRIEGFVLEDSNGFQFKVKCGYYNFWKSVRRIIREGGNKENAIKFMSENQRQMLNDVLAIYDESMSLFDLRKAYENK